MSVVPFRIMQTGRINVPALNSATYQRDEWGILVGVFGVAPASVASSRGSLTVSDRSVTFLGVRDQSA